MLKIDLHTHSSTSPDGGIKPEQYAQVVEDGLLDYIAVTDHDRLDTALQLRETLGKHIIVGEEITTTGGEIIGLFLKEVIKPGQSPLATAEAIKAQGGLVYIPHPFETVRKGLSGQNLDSLAAFVDIVEAHNGRAVFQNKGPQAATWARLHQKPIVASSDAHGYKGLGTTYTFISKEPSAKNLAEQLVQARFALNRPPLRSLLYPKLHRLRRKLGSKS